MSLFDVGVVGRLSGRSLDTGDPEDDVRAIDSQWLNRPFAADRVPVYHDRASCPDAMGAERLSIIERQEAREHSVPCPICVIDGTPENGIQTPADVVDAMGGRAPETAERAAARARMAHDGGED